MKEIKRVEMPEEAMLIKSRLESSGIDCFLKDLEIVSVYFLYSNAIGGIKILVPDANENEAIELLKSAPLHVNNKHCPHCNSQNLWYRKFGILNGLCILSGFCLPNRQSAYFCRNCNTKFQEKEIHITNESDYPDLIELNQIAESQAKSDIVEQNLPDYFNLIRNAVVSVLIMLALTPIFYDLNNALPTMKHYIWGTFTGIIIGWLINYSTKLRQQLKQSSSNPPQNPQAES